MSLKKTIKIAAMFALFGVFICAGTTKTWASTGMTGGPGLKSAAYVATVDVTSVNINVSHDSDEVLLNATQGQSFDILEDMGDGWVKVRVNDTHGYLPLDGNATISELTEALEGESGLEEAAGISESEVRRQNLVDFSLQFVGCKYRHGGNDPRTGVDCSGFTRYVMLHGAGVNLNRSSSAQATQGRAIGADQMRPGDLLFYGNGKSINHVAMYIGNGQIVHSSTYSTGVKVSAWNYRQPVKIVNVLGD